MRIRMMFAAAAAVMIGATAIAAAGIPAAPQTARTWTLGEDADTKKNPLKADEKTLNEGKGLYKAKCSRCHGPAGLGDGQDAEPDLPEMNLTEPKRAPRNTDGVVFYKILNGRGRPKMPAFKDELTEQQIWAVVTYVQTLRRGRS